MFTKFIAKFGFALGCTAALIVLALYCGLSWLVTCGLVYLITLCFDVAFTWSAATGVWLVWIILNSIFGRGDSK